MQVDEEIGSRSQIQGGDLELESEELAFLFLVIMLSFATRGF